MAGWGIATCNQRLFGAHRHQGFRLDASTNPRDAGATRKDLYFYFTVPLPRLCFSRGRFTEFYRFLPLPALLGGGGAAAGQDARLYGRHGCLPPRWNAGARPTLRRRGEKLNELNGLTEILSERGREDRGPEAV